MSCDSDVIGLTGHVTLVQLLLQYLVSIPLLMLRPWAFVAMISQVSSHDSHVTTLTPRLYPVSHNARLGMGLRSRAARLGGEHEKRLS